MSDYEESMLKNTPRSVLGKAFSCLPLPALLMIIAVLFCQACGQEDRSPQNPAATQSLTIDYNFTPMFPMTPDKALTPGALCDQPDEFRYPAQIPYCKRRVSSRAKWQIIHAYDQSLGFHIADEIGTQGRAAFKIDHLIPLSLGGSNDSRNLWPQHRSAYKVTDPLEAQLFKELAAGRIAQEEAVAMIIEAKLNLLQAPEIAKALAAH